MNWDVNDLRVAVTVLSFFVFAGIWVWAWSRKNASGFAEAAHLPFAEEEQRPTLSEGRSLYSASGELSSVRAAAPGRPKQGPTLSEGRSLYSASGELS